MGFLLKIAIVGFVAWSVWKAANRWFNLLGGNRPRPPIEPQTPPPRRVVEDTYPCTVCGAYVALGAAKCGRQDCPQG